MDASTCNISSPCFRMVNQQNTYPRGLGIFNMP
jgi:hypothetical protein